MATKKKDLAGALNETRTAAATYTGEPTAPEATTAYVQNPEEEQQQKRKRQRRGEKLDLISFACPPQLLKESRRLAHYRQQTHSTLIQQILQEYIDAHREEIAAFDAVYEQLGKPLPNPNE